MPTLVSGRQNGQHGAKGLPFIISELQSCLYGQRNFPGQPGQHALTGALA